MFCKWTGKVVEGRLIISIDDREILSFEKGKWVASRIDFSEDIYLIAVHICDGDYYTLLSLKDEAGNEVFQSKARGPAGTVGFIAEEVRCAKT